MSYISCLDFFLLFNYYLVYFSSLGLFTSCLRYSALFAFVKESIFFTNGVGVNKIFFSLSVFLPFLINIIHQQFLTFHTASSQLLQILWRILGHQFLLLAHNLFIACSPCLLTFYLLHLGVIPCEKSEKKVTDFLGGILDLKSQKY